MTFFFFTDLATNHNFHKVTIPTIIALSIFLFALQLFLCLKSKHLGVKLIPFFVLALPTIEFSLYILALILHDDFGWVSLFAKIYTVSIIPMLLSVGIACILGSIISALKKRKLTRKN